MSDFYAEYLVEKRPTGADTTKKVLIFIGMFVLSLVLFMFFSIFGIILIGFLLYGGFYLLSGLSTEYEYIITNGSFDIDKVSGKRSRKRLISTEISTFTDFGRLSDAPDEQPDCTVVLASDNMGGEDYYADLKHASAGNVRVIFSPNEKIVEGIEMYLPRQVKLQYRQKYGK